MGGDFRLKWAGTALLNCLVLASVVSSADRPGHLPARPARVTDVVLHDGVLYGIVSGASAASSVSANKVSEKAAGVRVAVMRDGKVIAETSVDKAGRFSVSNLRGGTFVIAVAYGDRVEWNFCRVWTAKAAPPKANAVARFAPGAGVVRGQGALPALSFSEAALMAGVVGGAVAAPIIYHNAQKSNRVPASP